MAIVGKKAPAFELDGNYKGETRKFKLDDFKGWKILIFFPRAFTGVCQSEIDGFGKEHEKFEKKGASLIAISTDSTHVHKAWLEKEATHAKYPLLSDSTHEVSSAYGVLADNGAAYRATFIINPDGIVLHESANFFPVGRSSDETLRLLSAFQTGKNCMLNWKQE